MITQYRKYPIFIKFNDIFFYEVWIDPHYESGHKESVDDELILDILRSTYYWDAKREAKINGYDYFKVNVFYNLKSYRLILVVPLEINYIGVRSVFRVKGFKREKNQTEK